MTLEIEEDLEDPSQRKLTDPSELTLGPDQGNKDGYRQLKIKSNFEHITNTGQRIAAIDYEEMQETIAIPVLRKLFFTNPDKTRKSDDVIVHGKETDNPWLEEEDFKKRWQQVFESGGKNVGFQDEEWADFKSISFGIGKRDARINIHLSDIANFLLFSQDLSPAKTVSLLVNIEKS